MCSQKVLDKVRWVGRGIIMGQLPVTSLPWCRSPVPHCISQPTENFDIVFLVNSLTIWCILMENDAFMVEDNCQHHFHLTPNLACLFWTRRPWSLSLWWLDFSFRIIPIDLRLITGNYCLHKVCILISTMQKNSDYCSAHLDSLQFWDKSHWDTLHAQIFCQNGLYWTKWTHRRAL